MISRNTIQSLVLFLITLGTYQTAALAQQPLSWRPADSSEAGSAQLRTEVSSARRVRIVLANGPRTLTGAEMDPSLLARWIESVRVGLALGTQRSFQFENTLALQPAVKGADSAGFAITLADSIGDEQRVFATVPETATFAASLEHAIERLSASSGQDLATAAGLHADSTEYRCERVRDSVFVQVKPQDWPIAKWPGQPSDRHPPRGPEDVSPKVPVVAATVILADGSMDSTYFDVAGTKDASYKRRALDLLSSVKWSPALIAGCPVVSKASFTVVRIGIRRSP